MKRITALTLAISLCLLFSCGGLFALQQEKPQLDSKYAKILVCSKALEALGRIGDPRMKDLLERGLKNKEFIIRASAAEALNRLGDRETIPLLKTALQDENYLVRILVTKALLRLGEPNMEQELFNFLNSSETAIRAAAVEQLGQFQGKYLFKISEVLSDDTSYIVRLRAIQQLGINRFNPAISLIEKALQDPNPQIRQVACIAMGQIGDTRTVQFVMDRLNDKEALVRAGAKEGVSLFRPGPGRPSKKEDTLLPLLKKDLSNKDSALRVSSFVALANLKETTIIPLLLKEVVRADNSTLVKKGAAKALRILKPSISELLDEVAKASVISSENLELNYKVGGKNLLSLVINALEDSANPLHPDAVFILGELKDETSLPALRQALSQEDPDIVANAAYVLGQFRDKEAVPFLIKVCNSYGL